MRSDVGQRIHGFASYRDLVLRSFTQVCELKCIVNVFWVHVFLRRLRIEQTLIADDLLWELAYAPAIGHPARLTGREEVMRHVNWFRAAVENFRFFEIRVYAFADPEAAVAEFKAEGLIKPTGRIYHQDYVV